jgi:hypothetical protein
VLPVRDRVGPAGAVGPAAYLRCVDERGWGWAASAIRQHRRPSKRLRAAARRDAMVDCLYAGDAVSQRVQPSPGPLEPDQRGDRVRRAIRLRHRRLCPAQGRGPGGSTVTIGTSIGPVQVAGDHARQVQGAGRRRRGRTPGAGRRQPGRSTAGAPRGWPWPAVSRGGRPGRRPRSAASWSRSLPPRRRRWYRPPARIRRGAGAGAGRLGAPAVLFRAHAAGLGPVFRGLRAVMS